MKMKLTVLILILIVNHTVTRAQSPTIKVMLEQIAALQVYIGHLQQTYSIAKDGLDYIGDKTGKEWDLHQLYFTSLKIVNPKIAKHDQVSECGVLYRKIRDTDIHFKDVAASSPLLLKYEQKYIGQVYDRLVKEADNQMDNLSTVISNNKLEMEDDERLQKINQVYQELENLYQLGRMFGGDITKLIIARERGNSEINQMKQIHSAGRE